MSLEEAVARLLPMREGHFAFESGHHGSLWIDLELLFLRPERVRPLSAALAQRLAAHDVGAVCGPLVEGAFVGLQVAAALDVPFSYAVPVPRPDANGLFPFAYRVPTPLRDVVRGRRVAVVNDVINAGSAVRGALEDLGACGATAVAIGTLAVLGDAGSALARRHDVALEMLAAFPNRIFEPADCPLCRDGVPLSRLG